MRAPGARTRLASVTLAPASSGSLIEHAPIVGDVAVLPAVKFPLRDPWRMATAPERPMAPCCSSRVMNLAASRSTPTSDSRIAAAMARSSADAGVWAVAELPVPSSDDLAGHPRSSIPGDQRGGGHTAYHRGHRGRYFSSAQVARRGRWHRRAGDRVAAARGIRRCCLQRRAAPKADLTCGVGRSMRTLLAACG